MLRGLPISPGIAIGEIYVLSGDQAGPLAKTVLGEDEIGEELRRLDEAFEKAREQLREVALRSQEKIGQEEAGIFEAHILILDDPTLREKIISKIERERVNASWAVAESTREISLTFEALEDEYFRARAIDIRDVGGRLIDLLELREGSKKAGEIPPGSIVVARELTPSETASFSTDIVRGILTEKGGATSHAAIVARALGIPCVSGIPNLMEQARSGDIAVLDGAEGVACLSPGEELVREFEEKRKKLRDQQESFTQRGPTVTEDGRRLRLAANIRAIDEAETALHQGAEGIGLFRTEFLFINREEPPGEEEQFQIYRKVLELMEGRPVVFRTLDVGGDKSLPCLNLAHEENPFLGLRGIRLTLKCWELFKTQLKALLRASCYGSLKIMYPMVSNLEEILEAGKILEEAKQEVGKCGTPEIGIMIETPAAALAADILADKVDFFSIGTNDLTQYTLAVDRGNEEVTALYDPYHPAVLQLIHLAVEAALKHCKWVGLCGELGGDVEAAPLLVGLGLDEISMSPVFIPHVKQVIHSLSYGESRKLLLRALKAANGEEVRELLSLMS